jgi:general secretion pathway protein L
MSRQILVYLHDAAFDKATWIIRHDTDKQEPVVQHGSIAELANSVSGHRILVFIPSINLTFTRATLPVSDRQRALRMLPYAVEDNFIDDVERLHFAITGIKGNEISVMAISREKIDTLLTTLKHAGISPDFVIPDLFLLPVHNNSWTVFIGPEHAIVRTGSQSGFACDSYNLEQLLVHHLSMTTPPPELIKLLYSDREDHSKLIEALESHVRVELGHNDQNPLDSFLKSYSEKQNHNLLQGNYSKREQYSHIWKCWKTPAALFAAYLIAHISLLLFQINTLNTDISSLDKKIQQQFKQALPNTTKIINPKVQLEQALAAYRTSGSDNSSDFLDVLARLAPSLSQARSDNKIDIRALNFSQKTLEIELIVKSFQILEDLKNSFDSTGLETEIVSATADGENVLARLRTTGI